MTHPDEPAVALWWTAAGTAQTGRQLPDLLPTNLYLDGRTLPELLAYLARLSRFIPFYTAPDQAPTEKWALDSHRPTLLLALIAAQPVPPLSQAPARYLADLVRVLTQIRLAAASLHNWQVQHLSEQSAAQQPRHSFLHHLTTTLKPLRELLPEAAAYEAALHATRALAGPLLLPADFVSAFGSGQQLLATEVPAADHAASAGWHRVLVADELGQALQAISRHFHSALEAITGLAQHSLLQELQLATNHEPEVGLLIAFAQLYRYVQQIINDIPARHLRHYYQQELGIPYRAAVADQVYLQMVSAAADAVGPPVPGVPAGALLSGGQDSEGRNVRYATLEAAALGTWRVAVLQTLFVTAGPGGATPADRVVQGVYTGTLAEVKPGTGIGAMAPGWPFLGADPGQEPTFAPVARPAQVGFAVAASVLSSGPSQRTISLTMQATSDSFRRFSEWLGPDRAGSDLAKLASSFSVQATTPAGWLTLPAVQVLLDPVAGALIWVLTLDQTQPALVGYSPALHGEGLATTQPALRFVLVPGTPGQAYGYSIFEVLQLTQLRVQLHAEPLLAAIHPADLTLVNQQGSLSAKSPFYPFGVPALLGNYLELGLPELLNKKLLDLTLTLTWQNLPFQGIAGYYHDYLPPLSQELFQVMVSYAQNYTWQPTTPQALFPSETCPLPGTQPPVESFPPRWELAYGPAFGRLPFTIFQLIDPGELSTAAGGASMVQIQLVAPASGFGAPLYSDALTRVVYKNAQPQAKATGDTTDWVPQPLPNPPLAPQLRSLALRYDAEQYLDLGAPVGPAAPAAFYHLHPFATYEPARPAGTGRLLPELPDQGVLYVGLSPSAAGQLVTLVFDLVPPPGTSAPLPALEWAYLTSDDQWQPVSQDANLSGDMPGFANAYRVALELPVGLSTTHRQMPSGLHWLRALSAGDASAYGQLRAIYPRLTLAQRLAGEAELAPYQQPLPAGTLTQLLVPQPAVKAVIQPLPSFGGRPAESQTSDPAAYYTRVSEQLRHRGRALSSWDYERLLLAEYPEVAVAKCATASQLGRAGQVQLAVLPAATPPLAGLPLFGGGQLAAMQAFLARRAPAAAQVRLHNPRYEMVRISCTVEFWAVPGGASFGYEPQLQQDLQAFLSPWAGPKPRGFGRIGPAALLAFIRQRPYVRLLTRLAVVCQEQTWQLVPTAADARPTVFGSDEFWVVLTSAPSHNINGNDPAPSRPAPPTASAASTTAPAAIVPGPPREMGIGGHQVGVDFTVT